MAAAVGDPAEFLDADVDQLARAGAFVAADGFAGGPVECGQGWQAVPGEDAVGCGGCNVGTGGQPQWADPVFAPQPQRVFLHGGRRSPGLVAGPAGAVTHSGDAQKPVAGGGGVADLETFGGPPHGPAVVHQAKSSGLGRPPVFGADVAIHTEPGGPHPFREPSTRVTNVPGQHT